MDARTSISDAFMILRYLWFGAPLSCVAAADVDDNGVVDPVDALLLLETLFFRHGTPAPPVGRPGTDPTPDDGTGCRQGLTAGPGALAIELGDDPEDPSAGCDDDEHGPDLEFIHFRHNKLVAPGDNRIRAPILFSSAGGIEGFTLSVWAPPEWIQLHGFDFAGTVIGQLPYPPAWVHTFDGMRSDGYLAVSVALSLFPPFDSLPDLDGAPLAFLEFSVLPDAPVDAQTAIVFVDTPAVQNQPAIQNEVSRKGIPQPRHLCGLSLQIVSHSEIFIRGDANRDQLVNLTDAVFILRHLFSGEPFGGVALPCPDAADVDDNGAIRINDAMYIVQFIFLRGEAPAAPFPEAGRDEVNPNDALGCSSVSE